MAHNIINGIKTNVLSEVFECIKTNQLKLRLTKTQLDTIQHILCDSDNYTEDVLRQNYKLHKQYVQNRIQVRDTHKVHFRLPSIPEDISENMIKFIIRYHVGDHTCISRPIGDLYSTIEGKQECKTITSDGPISFGPQESWQVLYVFDARKWLQDYYEIHRLS